jgi:predicted ester cyclase
VSSETNQRNKKLVTEFWRELENSDRDHIIDTVRKYTSEDCIWHGPDPIGDLKTADDFVSGFLRPFAESFPGANREAYIVFGGNSNGRIDGQQDGRMWVCGTGMLNATFASDYLTIPASGLDVSIRWGEFCRIENGEIVEIFFLLDLIDLMQQAGINVLSPSRGADGVYPPPREDDGVLLDEQDEDESAHTLQHIRRFIFEGLNSYDQSELKSMGMADFFRPDIQWYGPGGIGACNGLKEFEDYHQRHWLHAFPDRAVQDLDALIAEGSYSGGPGWAGVKATHTGEYLDCQATGRAIEFNGLDFWKLENDMYVENWVFVDMIHLFRQFGVDLFERMADLRSGVSAS